MISHDLLLITQSYITEHIDTFHDKRLQKLTTLKLHTILRRKNPYLFRAKNILTAYDLIQSFLDAYISSQEETIFGDFLEGLAIQINQMVYQGIKSSAEGIDLEFNNEGVRYLVSVKSGPNWGNSSQIKRMIDNFKKAKKILRTSQSKLQVIAVNGCCYGKENQPDKGDYLKYCGQDFWTFISGELDLYTEIITPLGHQAKQRNERFHNEYAKVINRFSADFAGEFCYTDGAIDWRKLLAFNSASCALN